VGAGIPQPVEGQNHLCCTIGPGFFYLPGFEPEGFLPTVGVEFFSSWSRFNRFEGAFPPPLQKSAFLFPAFFGLGKKPLGGGGWGAGTIEGKQTPEKKKKKKMAARIVGHRRWLGKKGSGGKYRYRAILGKGGVRGRALFLPGTNKKKRGPQPRGRGETWNCWVFISRGDFSLGER